jgi:ATP/maltotriose-dependent transcriptional regulator MalT
MQTHWLTQTKFVSLRLCTGFVPRDRLLDALHAASQASTLTPISAPAGYGKPTLLATRYAQLRGKAVVWLALDEEDNDPARLLKARVTALPKAQPYFGENLQALPAGLEQPAGEEGEFVTLRLFDGEDYEAAVVPPKARAVLTHFEARSQHYAVRAEKSGEGD